MSLIKDFLKDHSERLPSDAVERMLLASMLHELMSPKAAPAPADTSLVERRELCGKILAELGSAGVSTPEETYGENIAWAVRDLLASWHAGWDNFKAERDAKAKQAREWRMPKIGNKLRCVRLYPLLNLTWFKVGGTYTVKSPTSCERADVEPYDAEKMNKDVRYFDQRLSFGVFVYEPGTDNFYAFPLECFEPAD